MATPTVEARESDPNMPAFPAGDDEQIMAPHLREDAEVVALTALASRYAPFDPLVALRLFRAELAREDDAERVAVLPQHIIRFPEPERREPQQDIEHGYW